MCVGEQEFFGFLLTLFLRPALDPLLGPHFILEPVTGLLTFPNQFSLNRFPAVTGQTPAIIPPVASGVHLPIGTFAKPAKPAWKIVA